MLKTLTFLIVLLPACCLAQFTISGRVLNHADTKPVADASVFLSNTSTGSKTAADGTFRLENAKPGKYKLVISIVGFETYDETITVINTDINLHDITIFPKTIGLKEVTIRVNHNRDKYFNLFYERFKREFLGTSDASIDCKILNPQVLDFDYDAEINTLTVSSTGFLDIENEALGYHIKYLLTTFKLNDYTNEVHYEGPVLFTEMEGSAGQQRRWQQSRSAVYEGSMMHFLRSAVADRLEEEGFRAFQLSVYANPARPPDRVIAAKIIKFEDPHLRRPLKPVAGGISGAVMSTDPVVDSLNYYKRKAKLPKILQLLMQFPLSKEDIIAKGQSQTFALGCENDKLLIIYDKNHHYPQIKHLTDLNNLNYVLNRSNNKELSLINFETPYAFFDINGWVLDPNSLLLSGVWSRDRVAGLLPVNYEAIQTKNETGIADAEIKNIENKLNNFSTSHVNEKVHLHLDRQWYGLGDTIWFKAYVVAGQYHRPSALSGVLHAELIDERDSLVKRLTLRLDTGISTGDFALPYSYKSGVYRLRAYTNWMLNDSAYFYEQKVHIGGINLQAVQSAAVKPKISSVNNKAKQGQEENPDVQFFPEGGDLVYGLRSKVAVKVVTRDGRALDAKGIITDQDGNEVASFNTQHSGMGQFPLLPVNGAQYKASVACAASSFTIDLPKPKEAGTTLTISNAADSIYVKVAANGAFYNANQNKPFYLVAQSDGKCYYTGGSRLVSPVYTAKIHKGHFPSGIVQFTLFSQSGEPLNERVVFVQNTDQLKLAANTEEPAYGTFAKAKIKLEVKNEQGQATSGSFSVAVTNETKVPVDEEAETTMFTDLLLTSELKGRVENPNYYFLEKSEKTRSDLDLLMLTQGYRKFEWKKILTDKSSEIIHQPETSLSLSGTIKTPSKKPIVNGRIRLTSIKDQFSADTVSDANGNFTFTDLNFNDSTKVIINAKRAKGSNNVIIFVNQPAYPVIDKNKDLNYGNEPESVRAAMENSYLNGQQQSLKNVIQLKEVKVKLGRNDFFNPAYSDNMRFSSNLNGPGNADMVILGDKLTTGGGGDMVQILKAKLFGLKWVGNVPYTFRTTRFTNPPPMALFIGGAQVSMSELNSINPFDVYSVEVLTSISHLSIYGSSAPGGAIIITMKRGTDPVDLTNQAVEGLITYKFNGFYKAREFYSPKYDLTDAAQKPDDSKTIYWKPNVFTDANGNASFEYFNGGTPGSYRVVIEGIDADGNLGRLVFRYKVR